MQEHFKSRRNTASTTRRDHILSYENTLETNHRDLPIDSYTISATNQNYPPTNPLQNANAIASHFIPGVNHLVDVSLICEGIKLRHYKDLTLDQTMNGHHTFTLVLNHDALAIEQDYHLEEAQDLLGKRLLIRMNFKNIADKPERDFTGVITSVHFEQSHGSKGNLVLKGYSPTILLDGAPHIQSFGGDYPITLNAIVHQIFEEGYAQKGKYRYKIESVKNFNLSYICQYNETQYNFLARLAEAYDKQFYYDGDVLHFGDLSLGEKPIHLVYGRDVENIKIQMNIRHVNRQFYGYNSLNNEYLSAGGNVDLKSKGTLAKVAYHKSKKTYTSPSLQLAPKKASTHQDITDTERSIIGSNGMQVFVTTGTTTLPFLYPGCIVQLAMLEANTKNSSHFTTLMITSIKHEVDTLGKYKGYFEAVDAETRCIPSVDFQVPLVEQQIATVKNNADPFNKGRVQVQFPWQNTDEQTEFIRIMTPDAGSSDQVNVNRGFVSIPEIGDQVVVGFIGNHPDHPYVMGSLFHGGNGRGGETNNRIKTWTTRSGCTIRIDDEDHKGSITIKDASGSTWVMDGNQNITVTSAGTLALNSKNLTIQVADTMTTTVGGNKHDTIGMHSTEQVGLMKNVHVGANLVLQVVGNLVEFVKGNRKTKAKEVVESAKIRQIIAEENNIIHAKGTFKNNSGEKSNLY